MNKKWIVLLSAFGMMAVASQAVLIDNFDDLNVGRLNVLCTPDNPDSRWSGTAINKFTRNSRVVDDGSGDKFATSYGTGTGLNRGLYTDLGANTVVNGDRAKLTFDMKQNTTNTSQSAYFGFASGGTVFGNFETYVGNLSGDLVAVNGAAVTILVEGAFTNLAWRTVEMHVKTDTDTYQVSLDGEVVSGWLSFNGAGVEAKDLESVMFIANSGSISDYTAYDNISVIIPEPATLGLLVMRRVRM